MDKKSFKGRRTMVTREEGRSNNNVKFSDNQDDCGVTIYQESNSSSYEISENERLWLSSLKKNKGSPEFGSSQKPKIQRVPKLHREIESNIRCYEPLVISIGPFHHGKSKFQPMEIKKELLAIDFADQKGQEHCASIDELYKRVKNIVPNVRKCYAEDLIKDFTDEEFARMMFLDGCFILRFITCIANSNYKQLQLKSHDIAFIRRDLFLLENQIPFEVLQVLMSCKFKNDEGMEMIKTFISSKHVKPPKKSHEFTQVIKDFCLDIFGGCTQKIKNFFGNIFEGERTSHTKEESSEICLPAHLLELLRTQLIDPNPFSKGGCYLRGEWCSYRSAQELRRAGIYFRPGKNRRRLSDVKFKSFCCSGLLTLPPITVDDSTKSELLNLVAYEACPDTPDDFGVTSYLCFMDSLIDHAEDVKELRSKGILLNFLGSDEEVANLFNEIARDLVPNLHVFIEVKDKIEKHCTTKRRVWMAEWKNTHFNSPWTVIAFIAAIFVIGLEVTGTALTGIQTYYAVHQK